MRTLSIFLFVLVACGCREAEEADRAVESRVRERASRSAPAAVREVSAPMPLLKTPRITISHEGKVLGFSISDVAEAEAAMMDLRILPPSYARDSAMEDVIGKLAEVDPASARRLLEEWDGGLIGCWLGAAENVAREMGKADPEAAAAFIRESIPVHASLPVWAHFLVTLPATDRLPYIGRLPEGSEKIRIAGDLVHVWLGEDPEACARWLDGFVQGRSKEEIRELTFSVHNSLAPGADTARWMRALRTATDPKLRKLLARHVWDKADESEKLEFFSELEREIPDLAERYRHRAIEAAPAAFAASLSDREIAGLSASDMSLVVEGWAEKHPADALRWAMDHQRPEAALALGRLYRLDPAEALAIAPKLTAGKELDSALSSLCAMAAWDGHGEVARELVQRIGDRGQRELTLRRIEEQAAGSGR